MSWKMMPIMLWNWIRNRKMKSCREVVDLLSDYLADELSQEDVAGIRSHLLGCPNCTKFLDSLKTTVTWTHKLREEDVPPEVVDRLQAFLRSKTQKH